MILVGSTNRTNVRLAASRPHRDVDRPGATFQNGQRIVQEPLREG